MKNLRLQSTNDNSGRLERDKIWYDEGNKVEYVMGSTSMFQSLEELGLNISTGLSTRNIIPHHLTSSSDMFCNRELNMQNIEALGFDMDWTLAQYNEEFDLLAFNGAKEKLISLLGYPDEVMKFTYTQSMYRRCCMIDKKRGNIIKFDRHRYVRIAEHGLTPLSTVERKTTYKNTYQELQEINSLVDFASIDTPFGLVDAALFAQLVDLKDRLGGTYRILQEKSYKDLWNDLRNCVNRCHMDGVIKLEVARNPSKYISYDPNSTFFYRLVLVINVFIQFFVQSFQC
jgi:HAD superfamily 5'-nucleotidase-like hydrolase